MSDDNDLREAVQAELEWDRSVPAANITVAAKDGVIFLSGYVDSYAGRLAADAAARRVKGVKSISEEIKIHLPLSISSSDEEIAAAATSRLSSNAAVRGAGITVKVANGWVTLTGQVSAWYRKEAVERDIRPLLGVVGISNQITIKSVIATTTLSDDIYRALHRSWLYDSNDVIVRSELGNVTLTGCVRSYYERDLAEATAWAASGVTTVENDIEIG